MSETGLRPKAQPSVTPQEMSALERAVRGMDEKTREAFFHALPQIGEDWMSSVKQKPNQYGVPPGQVQMFGSIPTEGDPLTPVIVPPTD